MMINGMAANLKIRSIIAQPVKNIYLILLSAQANDLNFIAKSGNSQTNK